MILNTLNNNEIGIIGNVKELHQCNPNETVKRLIFKNIRSLEGTVVHGFDLRTINELVLEDVAVVKPGLFSTDFNYPENSSKNIKLYMDNVGSMYIKDLRKFKSYDVLWLNKIWLLIAENEDDYSYVVENIDKVGAISYYLECLYNNKLYQLTQHRDDNISITEVTNNLLYCKESLDRTIDYIFKDDMEAFFFNQKGELPKSDIGKHKDICFYNHSKLSHMHLTYMNSPYSVTLYKCKDVTLTSASYIDSAKEVRLIDNSYKNITEREFIATLKKLNNEIQIRNKITNEQKLLYGYLSLNNK